MVKLELDFAEGLLQFFSLQRDGAPIELNFLSLLNNFFALGKSDLHLLVDLSLVLSLVIHLGVLLKATGQLALAKSHKRVNMLLAFNVDRSVQLVLGTLDLLVNEFSL